MARPVKKTTCSPEDAERLRKMANGQKIEVRLQERAKIVLAALDGKSAQSIAEELGCNCHTAHLWTNRFRAEGLAGLRDRPRSGKPRKYGEETRGRILALLNTAPPEGYARWDGGMIAGRLGISADIVWKMLRKEGVQLARQRSWCISTDPEFTAKSADIVGLYLNPPENAIVICLDEKPGIQALSRRIGYVKTAYGKVMRAYKSTYRRNGVLNLFGALEVATGRIHGKVTKHKKRVDFLQFMDELLAELPHGEGVEYHVVMDNYCVHKKNDEWLKAHPNASFHYTPTSASWLNQVEIWFGIMSRKTLRGASFDSTEQLRIALEAYIKDYNQSAEPFQWKKRDVKGTQIH